MYYLNLLIKNIRGYKNEISYIHIKKEIEELEFLSIRRVKGNLKSLNSIWHSIWKEYLCRTLLVYVYYIQIVFEIDKIIKYRDEVFRKTDSILSKKNLLLWLYELYGYKLFDM